MQQVSAGGEEIQIHRRYTGPIGSMPYVHYACGTWRVVGRQLRGAGDNAQLRASGSKLPHVTLSVHTALISSGTSLCQVRRLVAMPRCCTMH